MLKASKNIAKYFLISLTLLTICACQASADGIDGSFKNFQQFVNQHGKTYSSFTELGLRFKAFQDTVNQIKLTQNQIKNATFTLGINKFSDLSPQEFTTKYCNLNTDLATLAQVQTPDSGSFVGGNNYDSSLKVVEAPTIDNSTLLNSTIKIITKNASNEIANETNTTDSDNVDLKADTSAYCTISSSYIPSAFDWRNCGAVTPVKNQGSCGCCWAFSSIASIEGQYAIKYGYLVSLSEQHLMNCDNSNNGCNGGFMTTAFNSMANNKIGVPGQGVVPYLGYKSYCSSNVGNKVNVKGYTYAGSTDESVIMQYLYRTGPISVGINSNSYLQNYVSGILYLSSYQCNPSVINHAVTIVGYGTENNVNYWIVKNSWGTSWGEKGYFRIVRGIGACGINQYALAPTLN